MDVVEHLTDPETLTGGTMPKRHQCPSKKLSMFWISFPLLLHAFFVSITVAYVLAYLDGHNFGTTHRNRKQDIPVPGPRPMKGVGPSRVWVPLQSDATTVLSVLLVITRFCLAAWWMDITWKCVFILLEKTGLSVSQIRNLINYKLLLWSGVSSHSNPKGRAVAYLKILVLLVLVLPFPAQISSPILTGSLTWEPSYDFFTSGKLVNVSRFSPNDNWDLWNKDPSARDSWIRFAAMFYYTFYHSLYDANTKRTANSLDLEDNRLHPASRLSHEIDMPYLSFAEQVNEPINISDVPLDTLQALNGWLNMSSVDTTKNLFGGYAVTLIPDKPWKQTQFIGSTERFSPPIPEIISGRFYVAEQVSQAPCVAEFSETERAITFSVKDKSNDTWCLWYQFYSTNILAGTVRCTNCTAEYPYVVTNNDLSLQSQHIQPDPLVRQALWMMPQVIGHLSEDFAFSKTISGFEHWVVIQTYLKRAYCASWNAVMEFLAGVDGYQQVEFNEAVPSSKVTVSHWRVFLWTALQALAWVAAVIFAAIQQSCKRPIMLDTIIGIIFLEKDEELRNHVQGCGLGEVIEVSSKENNNVVGILKLDYDVKSRRSQLRKWVPADAE